MPPGAQRLPECASFSALCHRCWRDSSVDGFAALALRCCVPKQHYAGAAVGVEQRETLRRQLVTGDLDLCRRCRAARRGASAQASTTVRRCRRTSEAALRAPGLAGQQRGEAREQTAQFRRAIQCETARRFAFALDAYRLAADRSVLAVRLRTWRSRLAGLGESSSPGRQRLAQQRRHAHFRNAIWRAPVASRPISASASSAAAVASSSTAAGSAVSRAVIGSPEVIEVEPIVGAPRA